VIAGPCAIESEELVLLVAEKLALLCQARKLPFVFKSSYKKANRSSVGSYTGPGLDQASGSESSSSIPRGRPSSPSEPTIITPQSRPSTLIGAPAADLAHSRASAVAGAASSSR
jgi:hypothetical protein